MQHKCAQGTNVDHWIRLFASEVKACTTPNKCFQQSPNIDLTKVQATAATAQAQQCNIFWGHAGLWKQARAMRICLLNMMQFGTQATASILRSPCESWRF